MGIIMYALSEYLCISEARERAAFHKSKLGSLELVNPLVSTPGRGFTGIYIYIYVYLVAVSGGIILAPIE